MASHGTAIRIQVLALADNVIRSLDASTWLSPFAFPHCTPAALAFRTSLRSPSACPPWVSNPTLGSPRTLFLQVTAGLAPPCHASPSSPIMSSTSSPLTTYVLSFTSPRRMCWNPTVLVPCLSQALNKYLFSIRHLSMLCRSLCSAAT